MEIERCLLVKSEVFIYQIPPRSSAAGYRAADWNLSCPDWTGRLRFVVQGSTCQIRLEDKNDGQLFAACPVEKYPGTSIEPVTDSSRYFVICVQDSGRKAYLGLGFSDRADSFDLNVALQDHFKWIKKETTLNHESEKALPSLNLAFKEGQTIRINIPKRDGESSSSNSKNKLKGSLGGGILPPPPPGGNQPPRIAPPPAGATPIQSPSTEGSVITQDLLGGLGAPPIAASTNKTSSPFGDDDWGDFTSVPATSKQPSGSWVQF